MATPVVKNPANSLRQAIATPVGPPVPTPLPKQGSTTTYNYPSNTGAVSKVTVPATNQEKPGGVYAGTGYAVNTNTGGTTAVNYPKPTATNPNPQPSGAQPVSNSELSGKTYSVDQLAGMTGQPTSEMWNGKQLDINGGRYEVRDDGKGGRTLVKLDTGGGGAPPEPKISGEDIRNTALGISGVDPNDITEEFLNKFKDYAGQSMGRTNSLADAMEKDLTENANRQYEDVLNALGVQKGEVSKIGTQQTGRVKEQQKFTEEGLVDKETTETGTIKTEKEAFQGDVQKQKEDLARQWRDLSMETQRIMRARGVQDSEFASSKESKLLLDFNSGLKQIAVKETGALQDFADAVIETNKFYTRQKQQLQMDTNTALEDIDNWTRQQIQGIQAQENSALSTKLADVKNAILQGRQLKVQAEQSIADKELGLGQWLVQMEYNYKTAVATAATGKVGDANSKITEAKNLFSLTKTILDNGGEVKYDSTKKEWFVHGINPATNEDVYAPITSGGAETVLNEIVSKQISSATAGNPLAKVDSNLYGSIKSDVYSSAGVPQETSTSTQNSPVQNGLLDSIKKLFTGQ